MRTALLLAFVGVVGGCGWPATRMEPIGDYGAHTRPTVSAAPNYTAGTGWRLTYSPDGSTLFVCNGGETARGNAVIPGARPAC